MTREYLDYGNARPARKSVETLALDDETTATCFSCGEGFAPGSEFLRFEDPPRDPDDDPAIAFFHFTCEP